MSSSEASTGYLQDAVVEWSERCKRRRLTSPLHHSMAMNEDLQDFFQGFSTFFEDPLDNLNCMLQDNIFNSDEPVKFLMDTNKTQSITAGQTQQQSLSSCNSSYEETLHSKDVDSKDTIRSKESTNSPVCSAVKALTYKECKNSPQYSMRKKKRVVYPFVVVKSGGFDNDVTLDDINTRILRRPSRPVRHPVGDYACSPCAYAGGLGPSGKEVISLIRIQTQGRGTITIIRTKG